MLKLQNIVKTYVTGDLTQDALKGVSISFRENEFVSILGQSGSGKTTMLNIIGGLDRYTSGDLVINGVSTKKYKDADWDYYRNNSIGFVFQSYNLIPHQTVLANVEMALTLSGVSKKERRSRAIDVLKKVGLSDHLHKKPAQMSGGQMQRVAIARALINNPDILLADEPTGALDSETSVQIMELLKEIAKDKLVIMVTHNPELAEKYSTRIVNLLDGEIVSDSDPYEDKSIESSERKKHKKISMSFLTALSLSFNNLRTKKGRTILTSFAGSIGIIGIALILALSTGMSSYITDIQKDTMTSYPLTISSETIDFTSAMEKDQKLANERFESSSENKDRTEVYADYTNLEMSEMITSSMVENNLTEFKKYLDDPKSDIQQYIGENGIIYNYDVNFSVYSHDANGNLIDSNADTNDASSETSMGSMIDFRNQMISTAMGSTSSKSTGAENFSELMAGTNGNAVSSVITDSYDVLYGSWPMEYDEVVLILNKNNSISAETLYQLGIITSEQYNDAAQKIKNGEEADEISFDYEELLKHELYLVLACDHYIDNGDGTFTYIDSSSLDEEALLKNAVPLKITGIIRPDQDADNASITTAVGYTSKLTDYVIKHTNDSSVIKAQEKTPEINVLNGMKFEAADDAAKISEAKEYISEMGISDKASLYQMIQYYSAQSSKSINSSDAEAKAQESMPEQREVPTDENAMASALDIWLENDPNENLLLSFYDQYISGATYEDNMEAFGKVSYDAPTSISIFSDSFEDKDAISECISNYNSTADEDSQITYTDYVALLTSSITTIIDGISYVLIAFVAISLIVSCIMIGIITHISVMERTKEIGILRALGASKRNISQVFNAETFIIGCCAGALGIGISLLALIPINSIIESISGISGLNAKLPLTSSLILIAISIAITLISGLLPAKKASKKDPVIALRTE